jgi:hypothetical protein
VARDWLDYLPPEARRERKALRRRLQILQNLRKRSLWVVVCIAIYAIWCLGLLLSGNSFAFMLALIPLMTIPSLGWLAWWLMYKEFHD